MSRRLHVRERNAASLARAEEAGRRARLTPDGEALLVKSDSGTGSHRVTCSLMDGVVIFTCTCEYGYAERDDAPPRLMGGKIALCKHASRAAKRLERAHLLRWDWGLWVPGPAAPATEKEDHAS